MGYLGLRAILVAMLSVPFLGPSGAIIYHAVVDGTLEKRPPPAQVIPFPHRAAPLVNRSIDAY